MWSLLENPALGENRFVSGAAFGVQPLGAEELL